MVQSHILWKTIHVRVGTCIPFEKPQIVPMKKFARHIWNKTVVHSFLMNVCLLIYLFTFKKLLKWASASSVCLCGSDYLSPRLQDGDPFISLK